MIGACLGGDARQLAGGLPRKGPPEEVRIDPPDLLRRAGLMGLEDRRVLGIDRQTGPRPAGPAAMTSGPAHHQRLLLASSSRLPGFGGRKRRFEPGGANDGCEHCVALRGLRDLDQRAPACTCLGPRIAGAQSVVQRPFQCRLADHRDICIESGGEIGEVIDIRMRRHRMHAITLWVARDNVECARTHRSGGAKHRDASWAAVSITAPAIESAPQLEDTGTSRSDAIQHTAVAWRQQLTAVLNARLPLQQAFKEIADH